MSTMHDLVHIVFDALLGAAFIAVPLFTWRQVRHDRRNSTDPIERLRPRQGGQAV